MRSQQTTVKCCFAVFVVTACVVSLLICLRTFADDVPSPRLFAPGVISGPANDLSPVFTPDGNTVYFNRSNDSVSVILVSTLSHGVWSTPTVAPFSGKWNDIEPAMSPDGSFLVFASNRALITGHCIQHQYRAAARLSTYRRADRTRSFTDSNMGQ